MAIERGNTAQATTLEQIRDLRFHPPPAAQQLESMIRNSNDRYNPIALTGAARQAIQAYKKIINGPSELDLTYRRNLLSTLENLESRLVDLSKKPLGDPAFVTWVTDYGDFKTQITNLVNQAERNESRVKTAVTVLGTIPDSALLGAALTCLAIAFAPPLVPFAVGVGVVAYVAKEKVKPALELSWKDRQERSRQVYANTSNIAVGAHNLKQLATGVAHIAKNVALVTTGVELPEKKYRKEVGKA